MIRYDTKHICGLIARSPLILHRSSQVYDPENSFQHLVTVCVKLCKTRLTMCHFVPVLPLMGTTPSLWLSPEVCHIDNFKTSPGRHQTITLNIKTAPYIQGNLTLYVRTILHSTLCKSLTGFLHSVFSRSKEWISTVPFTC